MPSPPNVAAVRCRLDYKDTDGFLAGSRFYLSYSGSAPSGANCVTLATDIATQWGTNLGPRVSNDWSLTEVDVLDLGSATGASGTFPTSTAGSNGSPGVPASVAAGTEFGIARRYRGGKPRMYLPGPASTALADAAHWNSTFVTNQNSAFSAFFTALEALSIGSMGTLQHVNISYYHGHNTSTPPWRGPGYKYPPLYRTTPQVDNVLSYSTKSVIASQKRRRLATTP